MSHRSLYRKYRPQVFADVVGQDHVTRTLRNAIEDDSLAHAYLFCGPRGTGKTTSARILAKALNCVNGPTPDPDDTCDRCAEISEGRHPDVYELDAASRTGVDAVRDEIIAKVQYAATRGGWKVYIIDEVHMLSTSAFNALLKTLEEPPPRTLFVLCTTHPHKVPETIHSRCQRFDFRRISTEDIVGRLERIAEDEAIAAEPGALELIARHSAGGMRDAIGTLDQLATFTGRDVTVAEVERLLGEVDTAMLFEAGSLIADRDVVGLFAFVAALVESGHDVSEFVRALTRHVRDLYVTAAVRDTTGIVEATDVESQRLRDLAARFELDRLARVLDEMGRLASELRWAPDARLALEVALARIARPESDLTLDALAERVAALEAGAPAAVRSASASASAPAPVPAPVPARGSAAPAAAKPHVAPAPAPAPAPAAEASPAPVQAAEAAPATVPAPAAEVPPASAPMQPSAPAPSSLDRAELRRRWDDVIRRVKEQRPAASRLFMGTEADLDGDEVVVEFPSEAEALMGLADEPELKAVVRDSVASVLGWHVAVRYQLGRGRVRHRRVTVPDGPPPGDEHDHMDQLLVEGLGAQVLSDPHTTDPGA